MSTDKIIPSKYRSLVFHLVDNESISEQLSNTRNASLSARESFAKNAQIAAIKAGDVINIGMSGVMEQFIVQSNPTFDKGVTEINISKN